MAPTVPTPILLLAASSALTAAQLSLLPDLFPNLPIRRRFFAFAGIASTILAFYNLFIYPSFVSPFRHLPGPKVCARGNPSQDLNPLRIPELIRSIQNYIPIFGHTFASFERPAGQSFLRFMNTIPNDGIIRLTGFLHRDWLLLTDPSSLSEVLVHKAYDYEKPSFIRQFLRIVLGDGLIVVEGDEHKFQRKNVSPAFSFRHIKELYPLFWTKAIEMKDCVAAEARGADGEGDKAVEINQWANKATLDIIGVAAFGRDFHSLTNTDNELARNYEEILEPTANKAAFFTAHLFLPRWVIANLPWSLNKVLARTTGVIKSYTRQLVQDKKELMKSDVDDGAAHVDILSILLKSNDFGDDMLGQQLLTFLAAGHETTSSAFTWVMYLLASHPEIQTQLREEIRSKIPTLEAASEATFDLAGTLESMPLLNGVCLETLRLYPTVPVSLRVASKPTSIGSLPVPTGTRAYVVPWAVNRSKEYWGATAEEFVPQRWIDEKTGRANNTGGAASNYNIMTFLHGPRSCIGKDFAKAEMKVLVAVFCGGFEIEMEDPEEVPIPYGALTVKPKNGMRLKLKPVPGW
jgi:cytochrome P450